MIFVMNWCLSAAKYCRNAPRGWADFWGTPMTDDYRIYVDANWPATLNDGAGVLTDFPTLQEAVLKRSLAPEQKIRATIRVVGGPVYTVKQIDRLHFGPKLP
jgi:hypothetical protein